DVEPGNRRHARGAGPRRGAGQNRSGAEVNGVGVLQRQADKWLRELGGEPTVIICGASALLVVSHYQGATGYFRNVVGNRFDLHPAFPVMSYWWWFFCSILLYMLIPLLLSYATKGSFNRKYGMGLGDWRAGLK